MQILARWLALSWLALVATLLSACASDDHPSTEHPGILSVALQSETPSGDLYRLRRAVFVISGASSAQVASEDHLGDASVFVELAPGEYLMQLTGDWQLEKRVAGAFETVDAQLIGHNPRGFSVADGQVTDVVFRFAVGDAIVAFGTGVEVSIAVEDGTYGATLSFEESGFGLSSGRIVVLGNQVAQVLNVVRTTDGSGKTLIEVELSRAVSASPGEVAFTPTITAAVNRQLAGPQAVVRNGQLYEVTLGSVYRQLSAGDLVVVGGGEPSSLTVHRVAHVEERFVSVSGVQVPVTMVVLEGASQLLDAVAAAQPGVDPGSVGVHFGLVAAGTVVAFVEPG